MNRTVFSLLTASLMGACAFLATPAAAAPVVVLKFDDMTARGAKPGEGVSSRWKAVTDLVEQEQIKASLGFIGNALENPSPEFVAWVKAKAETGRYQFWNHGYTHAEQPAVNGKRQAEFSGPDADTQKASLEHTQRLAKEKLGLTLTAFGSPFNLMDGNTTLAMEQVPELTVWLFGPSKAKGCTKCVLPRVMDLEYPTMKPNAARLKEAFEAKGKNAQVITLQGHPNGWDAKGLDEVRQAVRFLKEQGCTFMTAEEYRKASAEK